MQLALNFEPGRAESYATCREYVAARVHQQGRPQKAIAAEMDYSPSDLSRKLAQNPDDSRRFTLDDLELYMKKTNDTDPILYLVEKYLAPHAGDEVAELERKLAEARARQSSTVAFERRA
ncbi:MAG: hypothetical protein LAT50_21395 [Ectothiorhodospiraceae bacterium]|nr:hypothetical protein [Ectothiorhodospiraceae bacterium]